MTMKDDPILIRRLPPTLLIKDAVERWPHRPDAEAVVADQCEVGSIVWVRTLFGIKQRQVRMVRVAKGWRRHRGRRYVVTHDRKGYCHVYWLSDIIRVQTNRKELTA